VFVVVVISRAGERLRQGRRFLSLSDEHFQQVRLEREELVCDSLDFRRVVLVLKQ
jgi:hypothetical protein